jgi:outer membrane protein assembly factor BamB
MKRSAFLLLCSLTMASAGEWTQWRGPGRMDHSPDKAILSSWPEGGPQQLWLSRDGGLGYAGFSVADDTLYTMGALSGGENVIALDAASGKTKWSVQLDNRIYPNQWGDGPRMTPTIDGDRLYALSASGVLGCLNRADGKVLWKADLVSDFGGKLQSWGYTESVLVDGPRVLCTPGGSKGTMAALDKMTGKLLWQSKDLTEEAQYSSPILIEHGGKKQVVQLVGKKVFGLSPEDGSPLWQGDFPGRVAVIPTPIYHDGHVYVTAGYDVGARMFKLGGDSPELVYESNKMVNHHGGVILVNGKLYGHSDKGGWTCQDFLTGEPVWQDKTLGKGCCAYVAGHLICVSEKEGHVVLVEASEAGWKEKGRFTLSPQTEQRKPQGRIWVHPVIVDGRLFLRDQELIYCYDIKPR